MSEALLQAQSFDLALPWEVDESQEERFKRWLKRVLIPFLILLFLLSWLPSIEKAYEEPEDAVVKTRIVLEPKIIEVPKEPEPKVVERPKPKPVEQPRELAERPAPQTTTQTPETKEDFVAAQGLGGLSSQLSALRSSLDLTKLQNKNVSTSTAGTVEHSAKQVLGKDAQTQVGNGVVVDDADMRNDAIALTEHNSLVVEGALPGGMPNGAKSAYGSWQAGLRDMESIRRTLESTKSRVNALYQKALLDNPELAGKFTFKIVIEPNGEISDLVLVASELGQANLEQKILSRIKQVNFGAKEVAATKVEYKFLFLPS